MIFGNILLMKKYGHGYRDQKILINPDTMELLKYMLLKISPAQDLKVFRGLIATIKYFIYSGDTEKMVEVAAVF